MSQVKKIKMLKPAGMIGPCVSASLIPNALTSCSKARFLANCSIAG